MITLQPQSPMPVSPLPGAPGRFDRCKGTARAEDTPPGFVEMRVVSPHFARLFQQQAAESLRPRP